jgi:hypothetical protein
MGAGREGVNLRIGARAAPGVAMETARAMRRIHQSIAVLAVGVTAACASDAGSGAEDARAAAWCEADPAGADVALTPADDEGMWARAGLGSPSFVELWRAGGLNEGEELAFPLNASVSHAGRLAIADWELGNLSVVERDGRWIADWAPRGQGPGELSLPAAARWIAESDTVVVFDIANGRVVFLSGGRPVRPHVLVDPAFLAPILISGAVGWVGVTPAAGVLIAPVPTPPADSEDAAAAAPILFQRAQASDVDTLVTAAIPTMRARQPYGTVTAPGWPRPVAAVGGDGSIVVGGMDGRYRIVRLDESRDTVLVICRNTRALPFSGRERHADRDDDYIDALEESIAAAPRPDSLAQFGRLLLSAEGNLWVQRDRPSALRFREAYHGVPGALYDVFDPDGRYLGEVRAPEDARLQAALGDTVWAYEIGELDETWVVAYGLRWDED